MITYSIICSPAKGETYLDAYLKPQCEKAKDLSLVAAVFNMLSDIYLLVLPIPAVWGLRIETGKKMGVLIIFATGLMYLTPNLACNDLDY